MPLIDKPLESLAEQDLLDLVSNRVREDKRIEFKATLPGNSDAQKKEFLADVSSFSNASGGALVFGIKAQNGVASQVVGLVSASMDKEILRLENILRDGLDPRIPNLKFQPITLSSGEALVIRIARSWIPPHRVKYGGSSKFYSRNSAGKYELDVSELRPLFALSASATERIRDFRVERLAKITSADLPLPMPLEHDHRLVLHVVPFAAFDPLVRFDLGSLKLETDRLRPLQAIGGWNGPRPNFDGLITFTQSRNTATSYLQLFRNGSIEAVNTSLLERIDRQGRSPELYIHEYYEDYVHEKVQEALLLQRDLGLEPPVFIMLSFLGVKAYKIAFSGSSKEAGHPIDQNDLLIPEEVIESCDSNIDEVMRRIFRIVWNAAGYSQPPKLQRQR